jgi:hypothetical protein
MQLIFKKPVIFHYARPQLHPVLTPIQLEWDVFLNIHRLSAKDYTSSITVISGSMPTLPG